MFASGMITRALDAFSNNLWNACSTALGYGEDLSVATHENAMKRDWVRSYNKFSDKWFNGDKQITSDMLKDVYNHINGVKLHPTFETLIGLQSLRKRNTLTQIR